MQDRMINSPKQAGSQPFFFFYLPQTAVAFDWNSDFFEMPIFALKSVACTFLETSEYYLRGQFPPILFHWIFSPSFALWSKQIFTFFFLSILYQSDSHEQMVPGAMKCSLIVFQAGKKDRNIGILTMSLGSFDFYLSIQFD